MHVELITHREGFLALEPIWNRLVDEAGITFPFVRHEWLHALLDCFDLGGTLYILVAKTQRRAIGIAPLMRDRALMYGIPVRRIRGIANVYSERFDFILPDRCEEAGAAIWTYLLDHAGEWDVLELPQLPAGSRVLETLRRLEPDERLLCGQWASTDSPYVSVNESWQAYFNGLKKTHRANVRRSQRHLETLAPVGLDVVVSNDRLESDLEEALNLEAVTWKDEGGTAIRSRADSLAFYRRIVQTAGERGWLRIYFLTLGATRIAVRIALLFRNRVYMLKSGYDPRYAAYAPGHLLCHKIMDEAWRLKFDEVDFLGDSERWKLAWSTDVRPHSWLFVFPKRLKPRLLHYLKVHLMPRIKASRFHAVASKMHTELQDMSRRAPVNRLRRGILRHGIAGCTMLAARSAAQSLRVALYRHERHVWYAAAPATLRPCPLPGGFTLQQAGRQELDLLSESNLFAWSEAEAYLEEGGDLWIVRDNRRAVFCCWVFRERMPTVAVRSGWKDLPSKTVCIEGVVTEAGYRGRGVAPAAWALIAQNLNGEGIRTIAMKVEEDNGAMRRAAGKAGFDEVAITDYLHLGLISRVHVVPRGELAGHKRDILTEVQKLAA
ncbi:MAG TPA: GNAT family N-acetyltransferase [Nitrospira sp.]|nr:GNAT family N-acetyltransferase [Nitrospira sp.]